MELAHRPTSKVVPSSVFCMVNRKLSCRFEVMTQGVYFMDAVAENRAGTGQHREPAVGGLENRLLRKVNREECYFCGLEHSQR